jgi:arginine/ornithine N-succinyltransferase beta subunit
MNLLTNSMNKLTKMLLQFDAKLKTYGVEPYGIRKLTLAEQRRKFENLTSEELKAMIDEHGVSEVNDFIKRFWKEEHG